MQLHQTLLSIAGHYTGGVALVFAGVFFVIAIITGAYLIMDTNGRLGRPSVYLAFIFLVTLIGYATGTLTGEHIFVAHAEYVLHSPFTVDLEFLPHGSKGPQLYMVTGYQFYPGHTETVFGRTVSVPGQTGSWESFEIDAADSSLVQKAMLASTDPALAQRGGRLLAGR
jgi:hypothetical protein